MTHLAPGIYADIPDHVYHSDTLTDRPALSSSIAKLMLRSPLHAFTAHPRLNPEWGPVEKKTFDIGRAAHRAVLGRGSDYVAIPDGLLASNGAASTKAAKEWIEDARERGLTPLKALEDEREAAAAELAESARELGPRDLVATGLE